MIDFDIDDVHEAINGLSYEEQVEYLHDRENDIDEEFGELESLLFEIGMMKDEIAEAHIEEINDKVLIALNNAGYDIPLDNNGNLSFAFEEATITIPMCFVTRIAFSFNVDRNQHTYREMISLLVPDYKQEGNSFEKPVSEETLCEEIVSLVKRLKK